MTFAQILVVFLYSLGLLVGQLMFKMAASKVTITSNLFPRVVGLVISPYFLAAMALYFSLSLAWVWILTKIPLSKAYPIVAINFVLTAVAGITVFDESVSNTNWIGLLLIVGGILLATR